MTPRDTELTQQLQCSLDKFEQTRPLPGISDVGRRAVFIEQMLESIHRVRYISVIRGRTVSPRRLDPHDEHFDPLKAAIHSERQGEIDEACWMVFFFVHFGKHRKAGWRYAREVYGRLGDGDVPLDVEFGGSGGSLAGLRIGLPNQPSPEGDKEPPCQGNQRSP